MILWHYNRNKHRFELRNEDGSVRVGWLAGEYVQLFPEEELQPAVVKKFGWPLPPWAFEAVRPR